jgi:50S ribosomal subunit-associated GTPase HflX
MDMEGLRGLADPMVISRLRAREPHSVVVSARTGEGIDDALRTVESELPRPQVEFDVLLPYERGDLINRIHQEAESGSMEHTGDGTIRNDLDVEPSGSGQVSRRTVRGRLGAGGRQLRIRTGDGSIRLRTL